MTDRATPSRLHSDTTMQLLELVSRLPFVNPCEPAAERSYHAAITHRRVAADPLHAVGLLDAVARMLLGGMAGALHGVTQTPRDREVLQGAAVYVLRDLLPLSRPRGLSVRRIWSARRRCG